MRLVLGIGLEGRMTNSKSISGVSLRQKTWGVGIGSSGRATQVIRWGEGTGNSRQPLPLSREFCKVLISSHPQLHPHKQLWPGPGQKHLEFPGQGSHRVERWGLQAIGPEKRPESWEGEVGSAGTGPSPPSVQLEESKEPPLKKIFSYITPSDFLISWTNRARQGRIPFHLHFNVNSLTKTDFLTSIWI